MAFMLGAIAGRGGEAVVKKAQAAAGDMRHHRIEHLAALLIGVKTIVEEHLQQSPALRGAEAVGITRRREARIQQQGVRLRPRVLQERDEVADTCHAEPLHHGILALVDQLVDRSWIKPSLEQQLDLRHDALRALKDRPAFFELPL